MKRKNKAESISRGNRWSGITKWRNLILFGLCFIMLLAILYPMAFEGLRPGGVDVIGSVGGNHQYLEFQKDTDENVLWNKTVFSGMPIYHRRSGEAFSFDTIIHRYLSKIIYLNIWLYLVGFIGMFYLLRFFKLSWWTSAFCALGFILIPHYMSILSIGHFQKFRPVMYMPLVIFFFVSFINKKNLLWLLGFIFSFSVQIRTHHYQVIFYQIIILIFLGLFYLINMIKSGKMSLLVKKILLLIPACALIIGMVAQPLFVAGEYTPYSIRGGTGEEDSSGLDTGYATRWSMHPLAVFNWVMPHFFGGTSQELYNGSAVPQLTGKKIPGYWGYMPFTQTYDYIGIILVFLALAGLLANWKKPVIKLFSGLFLLCLLLSFGRHFQAFYDIFFNYVPAFNKFRVPAMLQLVMFLLTVIYAGFGLESILTWNISKPSITLVYVPGLKHDITQSLPPQENIKLKKTIITVGILLIIAGLVPYLFGSSFNMIKGDEVSQYGSETAALIASARLDMMHSDGLRLILFTLAMTLVVWLQITGKLKPAFFMILLFGLMLADQVPYMIRSEGDLNNPTALENAHFRLTKTNQKLLQDESYYRVFPITENPFNSNDYSYYHNSIGGYNAAKLRIYQDIIEFCLYKGNDPKLPLNWNILKMLNTKYIISKQALPEDHLQVYYYDKSKEMITYKTDFEARPAWFVENYQVVTERQERFAALNDPQFDAYKTALLEEDPGVNISQPQQGNIELEEASYNRMSYRVSHEVPALLVVSEIYYPRGWKCYVDGEEQEIYKTDHVLRSVLLEKTGEQEVSFVFEPDTYLRYLWLSKIAHIIAWLLLIGLAAYNIRNKRKNKAYNE
ncbi:MAG: hypothetical protein K9M99_01480 [Candidatus Cloacimonetes bacterium]|nr:hypothetical protein [Candidatus Cloacimonadota bacterium]